MRINSISSSNFRTLQEFEIEFSGNYCTLSGQNNDGKTGIVKIIQHFFENPEDELYIGPLDKSISFAKDKTQWSDDEEMEISVRLEIDRVDDAEVFFVIEKFSPVEISVDRARVRLSQKFDKSSTSVSCRVEGVDVDSQTASEILKKLRSASNLVVHNSTRPKRHFYYLTEGYTEVLHAHMTPEDRKSISDAEKTLQKRVKKAARQHKEALAHLMGKLSDNYQVDFSTVDSAGSSSFPLGIKLTDKNVDLPLMDWGSGTQNRTRVLMSILDAARIRSSQVAENRSTPVVIVEEPESFLHPSAQAEFGKVLNELAEELDIQIIATTHSPYMLNQSNPEANVLLERKIFRGKLKETNITETGGDKWMLPFAKNLGIVPDEFGAWQSVFTSKNNRVVLVEGSIDEEYFQHIKANYPQIYQIPEDVQVVSYGGKDALKNTPLLKFLVGKFEKVFVTFDLDAKADVENSLQRIGLEEVKDYCSIGLPDSGNDCIEGLLPEALKARVYSKEHKLVTALSSGDNKARRDAREQLKARMLSEFKATSCSDSELRNFKKTFGVIGKQFS